MQRDNRFSRLRVNRGKRNWADNIDCAALMFYWIRSLAALSSRVGTRPRKKSSRCRRCATDSFPSHGQKRAKRETTSLANRFHPRFYSPFFSSYVFHSIHIYIYLLFVEKHIRMKICPCKLSRWKRLTFTGRNLEEETWWKWVKLVKDELFSKEK